MWQGVLSELLRQLLRYKTIGAAGTGQAGAAAGGVGSGPAAESPSRMLSGTGSMGASQKFRSSGDAAGFGF